VFVGTVKVGTVFVGTVKVGAVFVGTVKVGTVFAGTVKVGTVFGGTVTVTVGARFKQEIWLDDVIVSSLSPQRLPWQLEIIGVQSTPSGQNQQFAALAACNWFHTDKVCWSVVTVTESRWHIPMVNEL
jgi:hypothetical protein